MSVPPLRKLLAMSEQRMFPILGAKSVRWELLAPHEAQAVKNHGQSLARLAERGGLSPAEAYCVLHDIPLPWKKLEILECERRWLAMEASRDE